MTQNAAGRAVVDQPPSRRHELDLLRALVVVGLVFFHTAVIFSPGEFPVKAETENPVVTVVLGFGAAWGMPLLFLISGMGIWYSLRSRTAGMFARERLRRLGSRCWSACSPWCRSRSGWGCAAPATLAPGPASTPASGTCGPPWTSRS
jgi:peptidoglycan/LPS O-acetylase OafA/YrhL